jgi:predicted metal-dependent RNase
MTPNERLQKILGLDDFATSTQMTAVRVAYQEEGGLGRKIRVAWTSVTFPEHPKAVLRVFREHDS